MRRHTYRRVAVVAAGVLVLGGSATVAAVPAAAAPCSSGVAGDVNDDGHAEVAIGEAFDRPSQTGAAHVLYGTVDGLVTDPSGTARNDQLFTQDTPGVPGAGEPGDTFGAAVLLADLNGDGCADLVVAAPGEGDNAGRLVVLYGSAGGVTTTGVQSFSEKTLFGAAAAQGGESFGEALTTGDFDDDGTADLAVGVPGEVVGSGTGHEGGVVVLYGDAAGLGTGPTPTALLTQSSPGVPRTPEDGDGFGSALAAGDVDGNGVDDLVVGVPGENGTGIVQTLPGQAGTGVGALGATGYSQDTTSVPGTPEAGDRFGEAVAAGDVTGDGRDDVAVGVPGENGTAGGPEPPGKGAVTFLPGSATGLTGTGSQHWTQDSPGVAGIARNHDTFGASLAVAPLDNGPLADLAVGAPFDDVGPVDDAGTVTVLLGRASGLSTAEAGGSRFTQNTQGVGGSSEPGDQFGRSVAAPPVQTSDQGSLVVGAPTDDVAGEANTGMVHQLVTFEFGPNPVGSQTFHLNTPGLQGTPAGQDLFGFSVG